MNAAGRTISLGLAVLLIIGLLAPLTAADTNTTGVQVHLSGPSVLGTLRSGTYSATIVDEQSREWSYKVYITAANTTGASPLKSSPANGTVTPENNTFTFDVTAQQSTGELDIHINFTIGTVYYEKVQTIPVVSPVTFDVSINNPSNVVINNATVQFFVDGAKIDEQSAKISAMQTTVVTSEWIADDKEPGWHTSKIVVDLNSDGTIDTSLGDMVVEDKFYVEGGTDWILALIVLIGLVALIIGFGYISKRRMK